MLQKAHSLSVPLKAPLADGSVDVTIAVGVLNEMGGVRRRISIIR